MAAAEGYPPEVVDWTCNVGHGGRSDEELLTMAKAGYAPAFAVLLHRYGPAVRSAVRQDLDPTGAVIATFVRAMKALPDQEPGDPVRPWLLSLAGVDVVPDPIVPLSDEERDEIWAELDVRWPSGRAPRRRGVLQRVALVAGLVAISALVPTLVLLAGQPPTEPAVELRAVPLPAPGQALLEAPEPLPSVTFPTLQDAEGPPPTTEPAPEGPDPRPGPAVTELTPADPPDETRPTEPPSDE